jgi:hypothetical protein
MVEHRADAYCPACGGTCRDPRAIAALGDRKPASMRPAFTGPGQTSFKPSRNGKK